MKRILLVFALFFAFCMSSLAHKTYVTIFFDGTSAVLSGDVPATLKRRYTYKDIPIEEGRYRDKGFVGNVSHWMGYIINLLAKEGFTVDQLVLRDYNEFVCILSKSLSEDKNEEKKE